MTTNQDLTPDDKIYEDEFDLREALSIIWSSKNLIFLFAVISFISFVIYSVSLPNIYSSDALLKINDTKNENAFSNLASSYSGLASMVGVSLQNEPNSKTNIVIATINSRDFFQHLSSFKDVLPNLFAIKGYEEDTKRNVYDTNIYDPEKGGWQISKPSFMKVHVKYLEALSVSANSETGFISLSVDHLSPNFAYYLSELAIKEVNNVLRSKQLEESIKAQDFLNLQLSKSSKIEIRQSITQLLEAQLQIQMLADVREDYILSPIDKAYLPLEESGPNRFKISFLGLLLGLGIGTFLSLIKFYFKQKR